MSRRNRRGNPISLFAFQDIITSVCVIFIVMVLLLTMELVERSNAKSPAVETALATDVREATARAECQVAELRKRTAQRDELLREVARTSRDKLEMSIIGREREIRRITAQIQESRRRAQSLSEKARAAAVEQFDLRDEREDYERLKQEMSELRQQLRSESQSDRPIFTLPRGLDKQGWLAVLAAKTIQLAPLGRPAKPREFRGAAGLIIDSSAADELLEWASDRQTGDTYFLLLIRPDGIDIFDELQAEFNLRGIEFGSDLIEQDQNILHPTRGAAP